MKIADTIRGLGSFIAFHGGLARCFGIESTLFLTQILFWSPEDGKEIRTTTDLMEAHTALTNRQQRACRRHLTSLGILDWGYDPDAHNFGYMIRKDVLEKVWIEHRKKQEGGDTKRVRGCANSVQGVTRKGSPLPLAKTGKNRKEEERTVGDADAPAHGDGFGLGASWKEGACYKYATKLHEALIQANKLTRTANLKDWTKEIHQLIGRVGKPRTKKVLKWYVQNVGGKYVPKAYSARGFVDLFAKIEDAMQRDQPAAPEVVEVDYTRSELAMLRDIKAESWPGAAAEELEAVFAKSVLARRVFVEKIKAMGDYGGSNFKAYTEWLLRNLSDLREYFTTLYDELVQWEGWNQSLEQYTWGLRTKRVIKECQNKSMEYSQRPYWKQLNALLNA
jgi:hypothetical protein